MDVSGKPPLDEVIADYLAAVDAGRAPDPRELIAKHPHLGDELRAFLEDHARMTDLAQPLTLPLPAGPPASERIHYFGDYELREEIARGGMGIVYRARQMTLDRTVAIKMLLSGPLAAADEKERFRVEAEAAARLDHPSIVPIYEVGEHDGRQYLAMRYVEGEDLGRRIREHPLAPETAARYVAQAAIAIHYAHERGVLHRDLKPSNLIVDAKDRVHVTDFGLAKRVDVPQDLTSTGQVLGTPSYMPPEQAAGRKEITPRADVYSLGAILYALVTGRPPFQAETTLGTLRQVLEPLAEPVPPRLLNPAVPRDLETIVLECLRKDPSRRYASAADLSADLERFLRDEPIRARPASWGERVVRWCRRHPAPAALLGVVSLLVLVVLGLLANVVWLTRASLWQEVRTRQESEAQRRLAAGHLHAARMALAHAAWEEGDLSRMYELLEAEDPGGVGDDHRDWAWGYLWGLGHEGQEVLTRAPERASAKGTLPAFGRQVVAIGTSTEGDVMAAYPELVEILGAGGGKRTLALPPYEELVDAALSGDGRWVAAATGSGLVLVWDGASGEVHQRLQLQAASCVAFSPDGGRLVIGGYGGLEVRELSTWESPVSMPWEGVVDALDVSPDGRLVAGIDRRSLRLLVWELDGGARRLDRSLARGGPSRALSFSADGSRIALARGESAGVADRGISIVTLEAPDTERFIPLSWGAVADLVWASGGTELLAAIAGSRGQVVRVDVATGSVRERLRGHVGGATAVAEGCDGVVSGGKDGTVRRYRASADRHPTSVVAAHVLPSGDAVVLRHDGPSDLLLVRHARSAEVPLWTVRLPAPVAREPRMALAPGGSHVAVACPSAATGRTTFCVVSTSSGSMRRLEGGPAPVRNVALGPGGSQLASVDFQGTVELWDVAGSRRRTLSERPFARDAAFLPGGTLVVAAGKDLAIFEPPSHELARRLPTGLQEIRRLAVSPDGASLAVADEAIEVWDARSLTLRLHLSGHGDETRALAFRQDGRTLASAGADTAVRVWDTGSGLELLRLGGFGGVTGLEFSPDWLELHVLHVVPAGREMSLLRAVHPERASLPEGYESRRPTSGKGRR